MPGLWFQQVSTCFNILAQKAVQLDYSDGGVGGASATPADTANMDEAFLLIQQITANIVSYCQVAMTMGGILLN